jgi:mono/diheme cytochrome c family protein
MRILYSLLVLLSAAACSHQKSSSLLHTDVLPSQVIRINTTKDTVIKTANGALLQISRQSFSKEGEVELEIKEAYTMEDIIRAGLTTQTDGQPLRSGGMIYLNALDGETTIEKPIKVSLPSGSYDAEMRLYKGEEEDGTINWTNPEPLADAASPYLLAGKALFEATCSTCHNYNKTLTGPALKGLEGRGPWNSREELFAFTRNPGGYIPKTCYTKELAAQFGLQLMPSYPQLGDEAMNALYDYIKSEDVKNGISLTNHYVITPCEDSCWRYDSVRYDVENKVAALNQGREDLIEGNEARINFERLDSNGTNRLTSNGDTGSLPDKVIPPNYKAIYYRFDITSFGWYNIDALLMATEENAGSLAVRINDSLTNKWDVFIAVPDQKVFDRGGKLTNGADYGFFTRDGKIPLRAGTRVIVFALGEANEKIAFAYKEFQSTGDDAIVLEPHLATKEEFNRVVKTWSLSKVDIQANDSKNADQIRKADREIKSEQQLLELYRPKNCDCNCGGDSTAMK